MVDNPAVLQRCQLGVETTPGLAVPATKIMQAVDFVPKIEASARQVRGAGAKYFAKEVLEMEWVSGSLAGDAAFTELPYLFASAFSAPSIPSQITDPGSASAPTGAYKWVFDTSTYNADNPQTYSLERGNVVRGVRIGNTIVHDLGVDFTRKATALSGAWIGQAITDNYPLTLNGQISPPVLNAPTMATTGGTLAAGAHYYVVTAINGTGETLASNEVSATTTGSTSTVTNTWPAVTGATGYKVYRGTVSGAEGTLVATLGAVLTYTDTGSAGTAATPPVANGSGSGYLPQVALIPIPASGLDLFVDPTFGALGTTRMTRAFRCNPKVGGRFGPVWPMSSAASSFSGTVELPATAECDFIFEHDNAGAAFLGDIRGGTTFFARLRSLGPVIYSANGTPPLTIQHSLTWDMACQIKTVGAWSSEDGVMSLAFTADIVHDPGWGKAQHVEIVTTTATLV